ncbi:MAG: DUF4240 domain-containing protein [Bacteroidota bacterium]
MGQASIKIPINKLSASFIKDMQEKYGDAELEITVNQHPDFRPLKEATFWELIGLIDWEKENDAERIQPVVEKLVSLPVGHIYNFQEILAQKLYQLDQQVYAENIGQFSYKEGNYFSVDHFLHVRACVVANGKEAFEEVLENPPKMFKDLTFEPLLSIASAAYTKKTDKSFIYVPSKSIETYSNKKGWYL